MYHGIKPISASTLVSIALHLLLAAAVLQTQLPVKATGQGIEIELVRSTRVANHEDTEQAAHRPRAGAHGIQRARPASQTAASAAPAARPPKQSAERPRTAGETAPQAPSVNQDTGQQARTRSTAASERKTSIIELLHSSISEHKQYPYLARRQQREGVATVEFVLHPDGAILNPRLVQSSRTRALDRAALDAVKRIEPFEPARDYLDQPEAYRVDVVFNVL